MRNLEVSASRAARPWFGLGGLAGSLAARQARR
jgi:hypothetical protein